MAGETVWVRKWIEKLGRYDDPVQVREGALFHVIGKGYAVCGPKGTNPEDFAAGGTQRGDMDDLEDDGGLLMAGTVSEIGDVPAPEDAAAAHVAAQPSTPPAAAAGLKITTQHDLGGEDDDEDVDDDDEMVVANDDDMDVPPAPGVVASPVVGQPPKGKAAKKKLAAGEL